MSTHNICFCIEIRKKDMMLIILFIWSYVKSVLFLYENIFCCAPKAILMSTHSICLYGEIRKR